MREVIEIWQPRYKDNVVLIATYKVMDGNNFIRFTKAKHLAGSLFVVHSSVIRSCPKDTNGKIACFAVPLDMLEKVEGNEQ